MELMKKYPSVLPFLIYIANEDKHVERFAVREKYMALDPIINKYVKYIRNIRTIQEYLCKRADKHLVPKINNTNVDRSVAIIHATVFSCLRRCEAGEHLYNPTTNTVPLIDEEYRNQCAANSLSSKMMFQLIQRKGSSRHLMALINTDGSVEKAWPVNTDDGNVRPVFCHGNEKGNGISMYGPSQISKAETVNLQFGHYGLSAWPNDISGSTQIPSADDLSTDGDESGSSYNFSCCSTPIMSNEPTDELGEQLPVSSSDEEDDSATIMESNGDLSNLDGKQIHQAVEEMEGSVDEESDMSDEEYKNLAIPADWMMN